MSYRDGKVLLVAHVEPALRDHAREAARAAGLEFSQWVARVVQQEMARESTDRAIATASRQGPRVVRRAGTIFDNRHQSPCAGSHQRIYIGSRRGDTHCRDNGPLKTGPEHE